MTDPLPSGESGQALEQRETLTNGSKASPAKLPAIANADATNPSGPDTPNTLTPEEQMALFEKDLKENDWGHQPC